MNLSQRIAIEVLLKKTTLSLSEIALKIGVNKSTISREIRNNSTLFGYYGEEAQEKHKIRQSWKERISLLN
ncbi:helix-turn-helix domain-containing protein, partial [Mycoplasmopsis columboralis]|uniref:helix-turn-helix domain-containing protein n=1 Tax=Mycoplasmopsis columboralis TaxID=171282 RepID=UPI003A7F2EED